jgi:hypothetical protein
MLEPALLLTNLDADTWWKELHIGLLKLCSAILPAQGIMVTRATDPCKSIRL